MLGRASLYIATVRHGRKNLTPHLCDGGSDEVERATDALSDAVAAANEVSGFSEVTEEELLGAGSRRRDHGRGHHGLGDARRSSSGRGDPS